MIFRLLLITATSLFLCQCGLDTSHYLEVSLYGSYSSPDGASGDSSPQSMAVSLQSITLYDANNTATSLLETTTELAIIDRPQLVVEADLSDLEGNTYQSMELVFASGYSLTNSSGEAISGTLSTTTVTYSTPFTVETAKGIEFNVVIKWQNTILDGAIATEPTLEIVKD